MVKPVPEAELLELFQAVSARRWEEAELLRQAVEMLTRQRMYIEQQNEIVEQLQPIIEKQQEILLRHGII